MQDPSSHSRMRQPGSTSMHSASCAQNNTNSSSAGMLSDFSGDLVIKPCTAAEIAFYEASNSSHSDFARFMPTYMGTLQLGKSEQLQKIVEPANTNGGAAAIVLPEADADTAVRAKTDDKIADTSHIKGNRLDTDLAIVLENVTAEFKRPNIIDIKLGKRLWADDAPPAKRTKLDRAAEETTSCSLGLRVAGMRIWAPEAERKISAKNGQQQEESYENGYRVFNKLYGRRRTVENVHEAFETLLGPPSDLDPEGLREGVLRDIKDTVGNMVETISGQESRMYSSSLLIVYEGDAQARREAVEDALGQAQQGDGSNGVGTDGLEARVGEDGEEDAAAAAAADDDEDDEDDDDEEEEPSKKILDVRLIDFAHAQWTPGEGPDENLLAGLQNVVMMLDKITTA